MRKTLTGTELTEAQGQGSWLDLVELCKAELSSEDPDYPFEHALREENDNGWKAAVPGKQHIRLNFDSPQHLHHIRLQFVETQVKRSQEFALFVKTIGEPRREVLRQQWSFDPNGSTKQVENFRVDLPGVESLDLEIDPGRHDTAVFASLELLLLR